MTKPLKEVTPADIEQLARKIDNFLNGDMRGERRRHGFVLLTFKMNETGIARYASSSQQDDVKALLTEVIAGWEGRRAEPTETRQ